MQSIVPSSCRRAAGAAALAFGVWILVGAFAGAAAGSSRSVVSFIPGDAQMVLVVEDPARLFARFAVDSLRAVNPKGFAEAAQDAVEVVGIDPFSLEQLRAVGVRVDQPLALAINAPVEGAHTLVLPAERRIIDRCRDVWKRNDESLESLGHRDGVEIFGGSDGEEVLFFKDGYAVMVSVSEVEDEEAGAPLALAEQLLDISAGASFLKSKTFERARTTGGRNPDVTFYIGPKYYTEFAGPGKHLDDLFDEDTARKLNRRLGLSGNSAVIRMRLTSKTLEVEGFAWTGRDSEMRAWSHAEADPVAFIRRLSGNPWLLSVGRMNTRRAWTTIRAAMREVVPDALASFDSVAASVRTDWAIDLETELLLQLNGNVGMGVERIGFAGSDAVVFFQVHDPDKARATLSRAVERFEATLQKTGDAGAMRGSPGGGPGGSAATGAAPMVERSKIGTVDVYRYATPPIGEFVAGVVDDHVVLTTSAEHFRSIAEAGGLMLQALAVADVRAALTEADGGAFYLDFRGLERDAAGFAMMLGESSGEALEWLSALDNVVGTTHLEDEGIRQTFVVKSTRDDIWPYLLSVILKEAD